MPPFTTDTSYPTDRIHGRSSDGNRYAPAGLRLLHEDVVAYGVPLGELRKVGAIKDALPDSPNATDLGLSDTPGAAVLGTQTNGGSTASATEKAAFLFNVPATYEPGAALTLRVRAKVSAARQVSATVDAVVKKLGDAALGSDVCATAAQALTTSFANYDFTITPTGIAPGDVLYVELALATDDTGGSTNGTPSIAAVALRSALAA